MQAHLGSKSLLCWALHFGGRGASLQSLRCFDFAIGLCLLAWSHSPSIFWLQKAIRACLAICFTLAMEAFLSTDAGARVHLQKRGQLYHVPIWTNFDVIHSVTQNFTTVRLGQGCSMFHLTFGTRFYASSFLWRSPSGIMLSNDHINPQKIGEIIVISNIIFVYLYTM